MVLIFALFNKIGYNINMLNLIVAPKKHVANGEKFVKKIVKYLKTEKVEYSVYFSTEYSDIGESVRELISFGETEFVIVGDDVIVNEFLNSVKDLNKIKLGIIPTNKYDDFARFLELETDPVKAIRNILKKEINEVDLLLVNDKRVLNSIVLGASVEIEEIYNQYKWQNFITEQYAKLKVNKKYNGAELTISSKNNKAKTLNIYEMVIANGGYYKGKHVSPLSNAKDGLFNLIYSDSTIKKNNINLYKRFAKGNHIYSEDAKQMWLNNLKITSADNKIKALIDGRIYTLDKLEITLVENAIKIYK